MGPGGGFVNGVKGQARGLLRRPAAVVGPGDAAHVVSGGRAQKNSHLAQLLRGGELQGRLFFAQQVFLRLLHADALLRGAVVNLLLHQRGQMALQVTPVVAFSSATALVRPMRPCLAAT